MTYIEFASDHEQTAFLAAMTPARALKDRAPLSKPEKRRAQFLGERSRISDEEKHRRDVESAMAMARLLRT